MDSASPKQPVLVEKATNKYLPENEFKPSDLEMSVVGTVYNEYNLYKARRDISYPQLQNRTPLQFWTESRELFWNSVKNRSEDLAALGIDFSIGFARKESQDFLGRLLQLQIKPHFQGAKLNQFATRTLQGIYDNWRMGTEDDQEKFWQLMYGIMNGTTAVNYAYANNDAQKRFLTAYDPESGMSNVEEAPMTDEKADVMSTIIPIEDLYFPSMSERDIQKMGKVIWRQQMNFERFRHKFRAFPKSAHVQPAARLSEDSLYLQLIGNPTNEDVEILYMWNTFLDEYVIVAGGIWLNPIGKGGNEKISPNPFKHKQIPIGLTQWRPIDNNFPYGMSLPFEVKALDNISNVSATILVERELRISSPPILTSDMEAPDIIFGNNQVVPVSDVEAYKEIQVKEPGQGFFTMTSALQNLITTHAQGGQQNQAPSRQPGSARGDQINEQLRQMFMANTLAMYGHMLHQEVTLVLKTALQFYPTKKFQSEQVDIIHEILVPNSPLLQGGNGNLVIRIVKKTSDNQKLYWEAVNKSIVDGKLTEIIEVPADVIQDIDFQIGDISLDSAQDPDAKAANWIANVLKPMVEIWMPNGLADPAKVFNQFLQNVGEHPADYIPDSMIPKMYQLWNEAYTLKVDKNGNPILSGGQQNQAAQVGNQIQQQVGMQNGGNNINPAQPGQAPQVAPKFGAPAAPGPAQLQQQVRFEQQGI